MTFKIVQTWERGRPCLCIVPTLWEHREELSWPPKHKNITKIIRDGDSRPGTDWSVMNCEVKRRHLTTFAQAEAELQIMQENSDTDFNEQLVRSRSSNINNDVAQPSAVNHMTSEFDAVAEALVNQANDAPAIPADSQNITAVSAEGATYQVCSNENINMAIISNQNIISEKLDNIISMYRNQNIIIDNMAKKIAIMSVQLEELNNRQYAKDNDQQMTVTVLKDAKNNESFSFTIIENELALQSLETTLLDKDQYNKLKKNLSFLCSPTLGNGIACAYKLLDTLFSRDFVSACSWSGGSRGDVSKVPLKNYKMFQKFFFSMIHSWDNCFTLEECEKFFKTVLKNANKRKAMKNLRASAKRSRKTKKVNKKGEENENVSKLTSKQAHENYLSQTVIVNNLNEAVPLNNNEQNKDSNIADEKDGEDDESLL